jgi:hypothetical protein
MYPVISETYIGEDIDALEQAGAVVAVSAVQEPIPAAADVPKPRLDAETLIEEFKPDVGLMHWTTQAAGELALMERFDLPFACCVHSFDMDHDRTQQLLDHPLCVAVFGYPHLLDALPPGVVPFIPTVGPGTHIPASSDTRTLILSASAGLPKKNFAFLAETMAALPEFDRMIVLARTNGYEDLPADVQRLVTQADPSIAVGVNVPRAEVLEHMARASVLLYTLDPRAVLGYPMSIVEAMLCGTIPIMPDRPEARAIVGPAARTYREGGDIIRHVQEVAQGGPSIVAERQRLVDVAQRHRDPEELGASMPSCGSASLHGEPCGSDPEASVAGRPVPLGQAGEIVVVRGELGLLLCRLRAARPSLRRGSGIGVPVLRRGDACRLGPLMHEAPPHVDRVGGEKRPLEDICPTQAVTAEGTVDLPHAEGHAGSDDDENDSVQFQRARREPDPPVHHPSA